MKLFFIEPYLTILNKNKTKTKELCAYTVKFQFFSTLNIVNLFLSSPALCLQLLCVVHCFLKKGTYSCYVILSLM